MIIIFILVLNLHQIITYFHNYFKDSMIIFLIIILFLTIMISN